MSLLPSHTRACRLGCGSSFEIFHSVLRLFQMCVMLPMCSCVSVVLLHIKLPDSKLYWRRFAPCAFERSIACISSGHAATTRIKPTRVLSRARNINTPHCYTMQRSASASAVGFTGHHLNPPHLIANYTKSQLNALKNVRISGKQMITRVTE